MKVNHSKKGEMLIESIVAMTVAAIMLCCLFATLKSFFSISKREKEYVRAENICLDIDKYYDTYGGEVLWARYYFDEEPTIEDGKYRVYYNSGFDVADSEENKVYELAYFYDGEGLHVDFKNIISNKMIIGDLVYGNNDVSNVDSDYLASIDEYIEEARKDDEIPEEEEEEEEETPEEPSEEDSGEINEE